MKEKKQLQNIVLTSPEPIDDGGKRYNPLYIICPIVLAIIMVSEMGAAGVVVGGIVGFLAGWCVKNIICNFKCYDLRKMTFLCSNKLEYSSVVQQLQGILIPLGITAVELGNSFVRVTYKKVYYDISYNADSTFSIRWGMSFLGAILTRNEYINQYKKGCEAYGIIVYYMQQICSNRMPEYSNSTNVENNNMRQQMCEKCGTPKNPGAIFCRKCGNKFS